ncbi:FlgK family flagellar hook-associated protein [Sphingomonas sp. MMS24-JH45]
MSGLADVSTSYDRFGRVTARLGGQTGPILVEGNIAGEVGYARNAQGAVAFAVTREFQSSTFVPTGGSLAGIGDAAGKVAASRQSLDGIARAFADGVNGAPATGQDLNGVTGADILVYDTQRPSQMKLVDTATPDKIAAASRSTGPRDGGNLAAFATLRKTGTFEAQLTRLTADNAAAIENRSTVAAAQSAILEGAVTDRDTTMGVNLDNEAIDLLRFQQAYQASSRVIAVAKEIFQSLMEIR